MPSRYALNWDSHLTCQVIGRGLGRMLYLLSRVDDRGVASKTTNQGKAKKQQRCILSVLKAGSLKLRCLPQLPFLQRLRWRGSFPAYACSGG